MFCKNCGSQINDNAAVCVNCGAPKGYGDNVCANCGQPLQQGSAVCMSCGVVTKTVLPGAKSKMAAGLLGIFLGSLGVHNFYLGYTGKAVIQLLLTLLSCGFLALVSEIWGLVEGIMILCGNINTDAQGNLLGD